MKLDELLSQMAGQVLKGNGGAPPAVKRAVLVVMTEDNALIPAYASEGTQPDTPDNAAWLMAQGLNITMQRHVPADALPTKITPARG